VTSSAVMPSTRSPRVRAGHAVLGEKSGRSVLVQVSITTLFISAPHTRVILPLGVRYDVPVAVTKVSDQPSPHERWRYPQ